MKGKRLLTAFMAGALAVTTIAGSTLSLQAEESSNKLNMYRFYPFDGKDDAEYNDGPWAEAGQKYQPLWMYDVHIEEEAPEATPSVSGNDVVKPKKTLKAKYVQPNYLRTEDGKVAYCIEASKDVPTDITKTEEKVPAAAYMVVKNGYPLASASDAGVSDIELEWATTFAVKAVTGGTENFDSIERYGDVMKRAIEEGAVNANITEEQIAALNEKSDKIKDFTMNLIATSSDAAKAENFEYDSFDVNEDDVKTVIEGGKYKVGPYKVNTNLDGSTSAALNGTPEGAEIVIDGNDYYVVVPEESFKEETSFSVNFTNSSKMLPSNVYAPGNDGEQKIFVVEPQDAVKAVTVNIKKEVTPIQPVELKGKIEITKTNEDGKALSNVSFMIKDMKGNVVDTLKTDENGKAVSKELDLGKYNVKETKTADGYILNTDEILVEIKASEDGKTAVNVAKTFVNKMNVITIRKIASDTNKGLKGATLQVLDSNNKVVNESVTDDQGAITLKGLAAGKYTVKETKAPEGYQLTDKVISFTVDEFGNITGTTTLTNDPLSDVIITKVGSDDTKKGLEGAELRVKDSANNVVAKEKTDKNGQIKLSGLKAGEYTVEEITAPEGYKLSNKTIKFTIGNDGKVSGTTTFTNDPITVELLKTDSDKKGLEGATIEVRDSKDKLVFVGTTNKDGKLIVSKLAAGTYKFSETKAPDGYKLNKESYEFRVASDGTVTGTTSMKNEVTKVTITKKDKADGKVLEGAKITIKDSKGKEVATGKTDKNGLFVVEKLAPGTYTYTEDEAPEGYVKTNEKATFTINSKGEDLELTLYNSKLDLKKNDSTKKDSTSSNKNTGSGNSANGSSKVNEKGEIIKTGVDDTKKSILPVCLLLFAAASAGAAVVVGKRKKD